MIVSALQFQRPERAFECLFAPPGITRQLPARTTPLWLLPIGMIGIETLLNGVRRQPQRLPPNCRLQRFQIQIIQGLAPQQCLDIPQDLSGEQTVE